MVFAGTIIEINDNKTYIMTMDLDVVALRTKDEYFLGKTISFSKKDEIKQVDYLKLVKSPITMVLAASFFLFILTTFFIINGKKEPTQFDNIATAIVSVDINPSVEFEVNKDNKIVSITTYNDEGKEISSELNLEGKDLKQGIEEFINKAKEKNYYGSEKASVFISVYLLDSNKNSSDYENTNSDLDNSLAVDMENLKAIEEDEIIVVVYVNDDMISQQAKINNISMGKQILLNYAKENNFDLDLDKISQMSIREILKVLNISALDINKILEEKNSTDTSNQANSDVEPTTQKPSETTQEPSETTQKPTTEKPTTQKPTTEKPKPTTQEPKPTADNQNLNSLNISVSVSGENMNFSWTPLNSSEITYNGKKYTGFNYYKIVASQSNPSPKYPEDGYIKYISDYSSSAWSVKPASGNYNKSPMLESEKTYYFSVTYVFENGKIYSNSVSKAVPKYNSSSETTQEPTTQEPTTQEPTTQEPTTQEPTTQPVSNFSPWFAASSDGVSINCSWATLPSSSVIYNGTTYNNFYYYKVVASESNPNPVYPNDGYLYYTSTLSSGFWSVNTLGSYNQNPTLTTGKSYYFTVTYVFENGKITTNSSYVTCP